jgi:ribosome-associated heat shock protein Hsp15
MSVESTQKLRLDKWLWAARFFKTRSLATDAINGGKVHVNQQRVKPAKAVKIGDQLTIRTGFSERTVLVKALCDRRHPASEAVLLYQETAESLAKREQAAALRRAEHALRNTGAGRPTKKERRQVQHFTQKDT